EEFWVAHQPFLLQHGYRLRDRYSPNWIPSWEIGSKKRDPLTCPDSACMRVSCDVLDAIRVSDDTKVALKLVKTDRDIPVLEYLNSPDLLADPRNHTFPLLEKILVPDREDVVFIVMPLLLLAQGNQHPFNYVSEVVDLVQQFLEGLEFMHEHRIAHRDACTYNLMVDSTKLVPNGDFYFFRPRMKEDWTGPVKSVERRSVAPLKYYFIDFETSRQYSPDDQNPLCVGICGQARNVPEMSETVPYNPFKLDVYQLGTTLRPMLQDYDGLEFLKPLVEAMTCADPDKRLTAAEAHQIFQNIISSFS
ncbi:kinase-like domain-containing protein, partial [Pholiota molesta]